MEKITYNKQAIKTIRLSHRLAPGEFAQKVGVSRQNVNQWEKGHIPNARFLAHIATAFQLDSMDIFFIFNKYSSNTKNETEDNEGHTEKIANG